jgi:FtsH-binding integral membrane protein
LAAVEVEVSGIPMLVGIPIAALVVLFALIRSMRRLGLRAQFMVLLGMGVSIGFILLVMVQRPSFPLWFGVLLMALVMLASTFGTRIFLRSLAQEDRKTQDEAAADLRNEGEAPVSRDGQLNHTS